MQLIEGLAEASQFSGWRDIEEVKLDMWEDCKGVVLQKNKKREFRVEAAEPVLLDGEYGMKIKVNIRNIVGFIIPFNVQHCASYFKLFVFPSLVTPLGLQRIYLRGLGTNQRAATSPILACGGTIGSHLLLS